jgi:hypothetical protein
VSILGHQNGGPELQLASLDEIPCLLLKHGIVIGDEDELFVVESFRIRDVCEVRVAFLAIADNEGFIKLKELCKPMFSFATKN